MVSHLIIIVLINEKELAHVLTLNYKKKKKLTKNILVKKNCSKNCTTHDVDG
jgi:hypothetical protein